MSTFEMVFWWYSQGWNVFIKKMGAWVSNIADFFSMDSLVRTLFKPYRQISAEVANENTSIDAKFNMFIDRMVSRTVGFFSRLLLLIVGIILIVVGGVISLILIIIWPLIPLIPIVGIYLTVTGFMI